MHTCHPSSTSIDMSAIITVGSAPAVGDDGPSIRRPGSPLADDDASAAVPQ